MTAAAFDLTNTQIIKTEEASFDTYTGRLSDLLAAGIVQAGQLPTGRVLTISWSHGRQVKTRCAIDTDYVRVLLDKHSDRAQVSLGVSREVQQARKAAERARYAKAAATQGASVSTYNRAEELAEAKKAAKLLAEIPATRGAFLRGVAHFMRDFVVIVTGGAASPSKSHGFHITPESLDSIHGAIDALIEEVLRADVVFNAERHAQAVDLAQLNVLHAAPYMYGRLSGLCLPNPAILQGEQA